MGPALGPTRASLVVGTGYKAAEAWRWPIHMNIKFSSHQDFNVFKGALFLFPFACFHPFAFSVVCILIPFIFSFDSCFFPPLALFLSLFHHLFMFFSSIFFISSYLYVRPPLWSSGQSSWLQIQRSGFDSWRYQVFWDVVGLERGPVTLWVQLRSYLEEKVTAPV
jgi:hypothetical protein